MLTTTMMRMRHVSFVLVLALCWACSRAAAEDGKPAAGLGLGTEAQLTGAIEVDGGDNDGDGSIPDSSNENQNEHSEKKDTPKNCGAQTGGIAGRCTANGTQGNGASRREGESPNAHVSSQRLDKEKQHLASGDGGMPRKEEGPRGQENSDAHVTGVTIPTGGATPNKAACHGSDGNPNANANCHTTG
ncbi:hypothetical protein DQ04_08421020 [Trypanosoma grayi]|uniref:hypothetical protein n=1 Tax=Trypanosoma grayi TaxID=71804 RepID=UPI0004F45391|nr:hypothetical protein DQ04_08421020 [Trypanosoma grayi]KEG07942.1 hypothetical protein DQ04_08421020 [Trypanosoma grayi]